MDLDFKRASLPGAGSHLPPQSIDPHYAWAAATAFARYGGRTPELFLLAFEMGITGSRTEAALTERCVSVFGQPDAFLHPIWWSANSVYGTALVTPRGLAAVEQAAAAGLISRFEVALMPTPERPIAANAVSLASKFVQPQECTQAVLYGVIDNGCPIASTRLRMAGGTRILNFWDQDGFFHVPGAGAPSKWKFGSSCSFAEIDAYCAGRPPADDWALYQEAGLPELARDASHGAHVLGCLFGAHANSSLLWDTVRDRAPAAGQPRPSGGPDLVFVQLPSAYVQGMPRSALAPYRLAGLRYVLECAGPATTRVVVPSSSENYDGSHDGQSLFDQATDALVAYAKQQKQKELVLLVSAGNSLRTNTHEVVDLDAATTRHTFRVRVLPGVERQTFVELWVPHTLDALEFALQQPGDTAAPVYHSGDGVWIAWSGAQPMAGIISLRQPSSFGGDQRCIMLVIPPTLVTQGTGGVAGDWSVSVRAPANASGKVCAYIARMTPGIGGRWRGYQSTFPRRFSSDWDFGGNAPAGPGRPYDEFSLSGLATADKITVVGGYQLRSRERARYSAGGPGRKPSRQGAFLIDAAAPSDQAAALPGVLAWGNRSAGFVRLAGTSVAAPLAARALAPPGAAGPMLPTTPPGAGRNDPQVPVKNIP